MITQNCDAHPLLAKMHKPDPTLPPDRQDKRTVVPLEASDWDAWLNGSEAQAQSLIRLPAESLFRHAAAVASSQVQLALL